MSQDTEREARTIHELSPIERDEAIRAFEAAHGVRFAADLPSDRAWVEGYAHARAALASQQAVKGGPQWREHVEQRIRTWRQRTMNKSGDRLAIDDFMGQDSIDDLVDFVCDEWAAPPSREPLTDEQIERAFESAGGRWNGSQWVIEDADLHPFVRGIHSREGGSND